MKIAYGSKVDLADRLLPIILLFLLEIRGISIGKGIIGVANSQRKFSWKTVGSMLGFVGGGSHIATVASPEVKDITVKAYSATDKVGMPSMTTVGIDMRVPKLVTGIDIVQIT
jgi:hypothetical protein